MRVAPPGQDLVRIGLVADVPDDAVGGSVEDIVQRDGQLDDAEARAEMPAGDRNRADRLGAQFVGDLDEFAGAEIAQVGRGLDPVEERRFRTRSRLPPPPATPVHFAPPRKRESYTKIERCANSKPASNLIRRFAPPSPALREKAGGLYQPYPGQPKWRCYCCCATSSASAIGVPVRTDFTCSRVTLTLMRRSAQSMSLTA